MHDVGESVVPNFEVVEGTDVGLPHFPGGDLRLRHHSGRRRRRDILGPAVDGIIFIGIYNSRDDRLLGMGIETTETIHSLDHGLPIDWLLWGPKTRRSNLMAVSTHHFEIQPVPWAVEAQLPKSIAGRTLYLQIFSSGWRHLNDDRILPKRHILDPAILLTRQACSNLKLRLVKAFNSEASIRLGKNRCALASTVVED